MATPAPTAAPKQAPKFPDPRSPAACTEYLLSMWDIVATPGVATDETRKRMAEAKKEKTAQLAISRAIYLGPAANMPGATRWLKAATALQDYVYRVAKEAPIASKLGGALADMAGTVAKAASDAAASAKGAAKAGALAVQEQASAMTTAVVSTAGEAVPSILSIPMSLAKSVTERISEAVPGVGGVLKVILGIGGVGVGGVGLIGFAMYCIVLCAAVYGGFYLAPKYLLSTIQKAMK